MAVIIGGSSGATLTDVASTASSNATLIAGKHNPVDASGGNRTMTLPTGAAHGQQLSVERVDTVTANTCTISGSIRGTASNITLLAPSASGTHESVLFVADTSGSWWPVAGHKTKAWFDGLYVPQVGGVLDGCTIGATTSAVSVRSKTVSITTSQMFSGAVLPWLNQVNAVSGSISADGAVNNFAFNDQVDAGTNTLYGLKLVDNVLSPAKGARTAMFGSVRITSAATGQTQAQTRYVGVGGRAEIDANVGGASGATLGSAWGGWFFAVASATATNLQELIGTEIDMTAPTGASVDDKIGILVANAAGDAVSGGVNDAAIMISAQSGTTATWSRGLSFGKAGGSYPWPFDNTSTLIGTLGTVGNANIGVDFSAVTFAGPVFKLPGGNGVYSGSGSPNGAVTAPQGSLYLNSSGGAGTTLYVKESGTGNTGWVGK